MPREVLGLRVGACSLVTYHEGKVPVSSLEIRPHDQNHEPDARPPSVLNHHTDHPPGRLSLGHCNSDELGSHLEEMLSDGSFRAIEEGLLVTPEEPEPGHG